MQIEKGKRGKSVIDLDMEEREENMWNINCDWESVW